MMILFKNGPYNKRLFIWNNMLGVKYFKYKDGGYYYTNRKTDDGIFIFMWGVN